MINNNKQFSIQNRDFGRHIWVKPYGATTLDALKEAIGTIENKETGNAFVVHDAPDNIGFTLKSSARGEVIKKLISNGWVQVLL